MKILVQKKYPHPKIRDFRRTPNFKTYLGNFFILVTSQQTMIETKCEHSLGIMNVHWSVHYQKDWGEKNGNFLIYFTVLVLLDLSHYLCVEFLCNKLTNESMNFEVLTNSIHVLIYGKKWKHFLCVILWRKNFINIFDVLIYVSIQIV